MKDKIQRRNRWMFGMGTIGRDMLYTLVSMFLMFYLTDVLDLSDKIMAYITMIMVLSELLMPLMIHLWACWLITLKPDGVSLSHGY